MNIACKIYISAIFCLFLCCVSGSAQKIWDGLGADELASTGGNWVGGAAPLTGDNIQLDATSGKHMFWDLDIAVSSWTQTADYTGTVTIATVYPGQGAFNEFTINNNCVINGGIWTHVSNTTAEINRLNVFIGGNLTVGAAGAVDATARGFAGRQGPGHPGGSSNLGGTYGGRGQGNTTLCYGSIFAPTNLGSGGLNGPAGGAVILKVNGAVLHDGLIAANGREVVRSPSGGSVFITAGSLTGTGQITANGGNPGGGFSSPGGGGRISLVLTNPGADFSGFTGPVGAFSSQESAAKGGAGTVYYQLGDDLPGRGVIVVDNDGEVSSLHTEITPVMPDIAAATMLVQNGGHLAVFSNHFLEVSGVFSNASLFTAMEGSKVVFTDRFSTTSTIYGNNTFRNFICTNNFVSGKTIVFQAASTTTIGAGGGLKLRGNNISKNVFLRSSNPGNAWLLNVHGTALQNVYYTDVRDSNAGSGVEVTAFFSQNSGGNNNWNFSDFPPGITNVWTGSVNTLWSVGGNWNSGRVPVSEDSIRIPATANNPQADAADRSVSGLEIESVAVLTLTGFNLTITNNALIAGSLVCSGGETVVFQKNLELSGNLTGGGTGNFFFHGIADLSGSTVAATGSEVFRFYSNTDFTGASFTRAVSTLVFCGDSPQTVRPANLEFYKMEAVNDVLFINGFSAYEFLSEGVSGQTRNLEFAEGATFSMNLLALLSVPGETNLILRSSTAGQRWNLNVADNHTVRGVNVRDSDASGGRTIYASGSHDAGNNVNWDFDGNWSDWTGANSDDFSDPANWSPAVVPGPGSWVRIDNDQPLTISSPVVLGRFSVGGGAAQAFVKIDDSLTVLEDVTILNNGVVFWNKPGSLEGSLTVLDGGLLSHSQNTTMAMGERFKIDLDITGDVSIEAGGVVDVTDKGYQAGQGTGTGSSGNRGASHGGLGSGLVGPCYGSIIAPTNLGSAGTHGHAGGVVIMRVSGTIYNDGLIRSNGKEDPSISTWRGPSGGSIFLTAGNLVGNGSIFANGATGSQTVGGGGRISLILTLTPDFGDFTGNIEARAIGGTQVGGAGTIYMQHAADRQGSGVVRVDNGNRPYRGGNYTEVPPSAPGYTQGEARFAAFRVANAGKLRLTNDCWVGDIWLDTPNAILDLGSNTLYVNSFPHDIGSGIVTNYGEIKWRQGLMFQTW